MKTFMNSCLWQFIEMTGNSIPVHTAGVGGRTARDPTVQPDSWQDPGSVTWEFYGLQQVP